MRYEIATDGASAFVRLTRGHSARVEITDLDLVLTRHWRAKIDVDGRVYAVCHVPGSGRRGKSESLHRFLMGARPGQLLVFWNSDTLDYRRDNLRVCSPAERVRKSLKSKAKTSKLKGACRMADGRWRAQIMVNYKKFNLGTFATEDLAAQAYDAAARLHFKEFARPNFTTEVKA